MCDKKMNRTYAGRRAFAALAVALCCVTPLTASRVRPVNLEEMTARADRILSGECVEVEIVRDPQLALDVASVTLRVNRSLKGAATETLTLRMLAGGSDLNSGGVAGVPGFAPGEEVILFLYGESSLGLTSPVGLGQGKFTVLTNKEGREIAVNGFGTAPLFRQLSPEALTRLGNQVEQWKDREGIPASVLLDMVSTLEP
jgi:hypothetical protein